MAVMQVISSHDLLLSYSVFTGETWTTLTGLGESFSEVPTGDYPTKGEHEHDGQNMICSLKGRSPAVLVAKLTLLLVRSEYLVKCIVVQLPTCLCVRTVLIKL